MFFDTNYVQIKERPSKNNYYQQNRPSIDVPNHESNQIFINFLILKEFLF